MSRHRRAHRGKGTPANRCNRCRRFQSHERHKVDHYCPACRRERNHLEQEQATQEAILRDPRWLGSRAKELANLLAT